MLLRSLLVSLCVGAYLRLGSAAAAAAAAVEATRLARSSSSRIVGGQKVGIAEHPYQLTFQQSRSHLCGASIISRKWAITAGHCVGGTVQSYRLGAGNSHRYNGTYHNVSRIVRHPNFNFISIDYDIALIEIEDEFHYGSDVRPIQLPERDLQAGELVNITGWGAVKDGGASTNDLMVVTVPIIDQWTCMEAYRSVKPVTERMICAGELDIGGKDSCQGDSGGPLSANNTIYGIVSWGFGCAKPYYPGVYSNVAYLRPWITNVTGI